MTGKTWTAQEEAELNALVEADLGVIDIAAKLNKTPKAVISKCERLGLRLETEGYVNTSIPIPKDLLSIEEALKILAGALKASVKPGLNRLEIQRLEAVANISKMYKELIADYLQYRDIERRLKKMEEDYAQYKKVPEEKQETSPSIPPPPVSSKVS